MNAPLNALVVMGVSGCGKSSVGAAIVGRSGGRLIEGDSFHPEANIAKMSAGTLSMTRTAPVGCCVLAKRCMPASNRASALC